MICVTCILEYFAYRCGKRGQKTGNVVSAVHNSPANQTKCVFTALFTLINMHMHSFIIQNSECQMRVHSDTSVYVPMIHTWSHSHEVFLNYENNKLKSDLTIQTETYLQKSDFKSCRDVVWIRFDCILDVKT